MKTSSCKGNNTKVKCSQCGKHFLKRNCYIKKGMKKHFCNRNCYSIFKKGKGNPNWKGGLVDLHSGYKRRKLEDGRYVLEHVYQYFKSYNATSIPKGFHIHHIDHNEENNNIDNLMLMTDSDHKKYHRWLSW